MATIRDYFDTDFRRAVVVSNTFDIEYEPDHRVVPVAGRLHADFDANAVFLALYVPQVPHPEFIQGICEHADRFLTKLRQGPTVSAGMDGEGMVRARDLKFAGRIFVYAEQDLAADDVDAITEALRQRDLYIRFRGPEYARAQSAREKPLAFISYDSSDREAIAKPLASALVAIHCPTWFDDYAMRAGDPLEHIILKGIDECLRCIVVLSGAYLTNQRWARWEFERVAEREARERVSRIIPLRCGVTDQQVAEFSSVIAHRRSIQWDPARLRDIASEISITLLAVGRAHERDALSAAIVTAERSPQSGWKLPSLTRFWGRR